MIKGLLHIYEYIHTTFLFFLIKATSIGWFVIIQYWWLDPSPCFNINFCKATKALLAQTKKTSTNIASKRFIVSYFTKKATPVRKIAFDFRWILQSNSVWTLLQTKAVIPPTLTKSFFRIVVNWRERCFDLRNSPAAHTVPRQTKKESFWKFNVI